MNLCPVQDDPNHVVLLAYPNNCRKYYTCLNGLAHAHECPDGYYWSQLTYRCDAMKYSNCKDTGNSDQNLPLVQPSVQYQAYPNDCSRYVETRVQRCPDNYHWNSRSRRCDLPQLAGCAFPPAGEAWNPSNPIYPIVPTAATPPSITQPELPTVVPDFSLPIDPAYLCKNAGNTKYLPYPGDCHKFIYCGPIVSVLTCPVGLYWHQNEQSCSVVEIPCTY